MVYPHIETTTMRFTKYDSRPMVFAVPTAVAWYAALFEVLEYTKARAACIHARLPCAGSLDDTVMREVEKVCQQVAPSGLLVGGMISAGVASIWTVITLSYILPYVEKVTFTENKYCDHYK